MDLLNGRGREGQESESLGTYPINMTVPTGKTVLLVHGV